MKKTAYAAVALLPSRNASPDHYEPYAGAARDYEACDYHPPPAPRQRRRTPWLYLPTSNAAWAFLGLVFIQAAIGLGLEGYAAPPLPPSGTCNPVPGRNRIHPPKSQDPEMQN